MQRILPISELFQSTLPRGERRGELELYQLDELDFNPRSPVGSDLWQPLRLASDIGISIHAPPWGATGFYGL